MITYKGSKLVKGKHFILEMDGSEITVSYCGKSYGKFHTFTDNLTEYVLSEAELSNLKDYSILKEHSLLSEQDNRDDLYQLIASYTDKQLSIIDSVGGTKLWKELKNSFQEELNKLSDFGLAYKTNYNKISGLNSQYLLEMVMDYLQDIKRNISETSLPNHFVQLANFIYNIDQLGGK